MRIQIPEQRIEEIRGLIMDFLANIHTSTTLP